MLDQINDLHVNGNLSGHEKMQVLMDANIRDKSKHAKLKKKL